MIIVLQYFSRPVAAFLQALAVQLKKALNQIQIRPVVEAMPHEQHFDALHVYVYESCYFFVSFWCKSCPKWSYLREAN